MQREKGLNDLTLWSRVDFTWKVLSGRFVVMTTADFCLHFLLPRPSDCHLFLLMTQLFQQLSFFGALLRNCDQKCLQVVGNDVVAHAHKFPQATIIRCCVQLFLIFCFPAVLLRCAELNGIQVLAGEGCAGTRT